MKITVFVIVFLSLLLLSYKLVLELQNRSLDDKMNRITIPEISTDVTHKQILLNGCDIHYYVSGIEGKETIVMLHPAFSDHSAFQQQVDYFSKIYHVITIDMLGHGHSSRLSGADLIDQSAHHIEKILTEENISKAHLVGVSMGSLVAQHFGVLFPYKTHSLTAIGGYSINEVNEEVSRAQRSVNLSLITKVIFSMKSFRYASAHMSTYSPKGAKLFFNSAQGFKRSSFPIMQGLANIIKDRAISQYPYPVHIITGEHDIPLAHQMAKKWHEQYTHTFYHTIHGAGHCANVDKPDLFNKLYLDILSTHQYDTTQ
ncbi:MAG: alpha/beta hydrolase [Cyclobacteriaceae bacterium]